MTRPPIRLAQFGLINAYLVLEADGLTLIDAGVRGMDRRVNRAARQLGLPLRRVALTHTHSDHVGAIDTLMQHWPVAELLVGAADTANLTELGVRTAPTRLLRGGDRVGSLTVIDTPGHSPGHVAYLNERDGTLYSGDTFVNVPRLRVASVLNAAFPLPTFGTHDPAQTTRAARALLDAPLRTLATGHGPAIPDPLPAMRRAVQHAESGREPGVVTRVAAGWVAHLTRLSTDGAVAGKALAYRDNRPS